ncbi:ABC-type multidrug transport system, ATPase and permease component [Micromonospora rhizosphaerae]|uniref:ABC-type multidrug transport system, ATPase and permease component n=1 Tax=Micromonospora rhizosphaerae TaxID=568872 RepID=A0A1C6R8D6_9ACTN|nr:ABC transporter ATP-binding protein [Micromonospora rhizosphaerae]SCL13167.1 ABC-type multidrug transport system, ATPase and permease component [Micromonospora rhizosphaerae]
MRFSPAGDPGTPDDRSATRYLVWLAGRHPLIFSAGIVLGIVWTVAQALMPAAVGRAVDAGLAHRDPDALMGWGLALLGLGVLQAVAGMLRHRCAVHNWLAAAYRTVQVTVDAANRLGAALPRRVAAGEVVSIGTADIEHIGSAIDITARGAGAIVAIVTVAVILLDASVPLGLVVVLGVPLLMSVVALLIRPLHRQQQAYRDQEGRLTARAGDIVSGLRVVRGVGGEPVLSARYRAQSQALRTDGVRVARVESLLEAAQVLLPGAFLVLVTWLGARFALRGEISAGQLVAFYGYTAFLVNPLRNLTEAADKLTRGHVAARRVVRLLQLTPGLVDPARPVPLPAGPGELVDVESGLVLSPGRFTALAATAPEEAAAIADRLGRYVDADVTLHGVPLRDVALATVRERILVADNDAQLFTGPLRMELDPHDAADRATVEAALVAASAIDIVDALPDGLDSRVAERGREFSGGQRQRLRLARALVADPETLVLVEPTSAVDAHTEARIADRLGAARRGRTTLVCTTSPLVLSRADQVVFVEDGKVVAEGPHDELLAAEPRYAATVSREEDR